MDTAPQESCTESKLLALHTAVICLTRTLVKTGALDKSVFKEELTSGRQWLVNHDPGTGHHIQAFEEILPMLAGAAEVNIDT